MPERSRARADALRLLRFRPRTERELRDRLSRKGHVPAAIHSILREFKEKGLVDDARLARYAATQRVMSRPVSRRLLQEQLEAQGVDPALAARAVEEAAGEQGDLELARGLGARQAGRLKGLVPEARARRLRGFLSRRGFDEEVLEQVVRELAPL